MKLHILNGDATLYNFRESGMSGDVIVWREMLSEGPVAADLSYPAFFSLRSRWFEQIAGDNEQYETKVIHEFNRLANYSGAEEVILWFEFDLHCQVNLIFLLNFFNSSASNAKLSLICPADHPNHPVFRGIGQLSPWEFAELTRQKVSLDKRDLQAAAEAWDAYCSGDPLRIREMIDRDHHQLVNLKPALEAHLNRFPDKQTGLSKLEQDLAAIVNSGITERTAVYREFWKSNAIYGMGDRQIDLYLDRLEKL